VPEDSEWAASTRRASRLSMQDSEAYSCCTTHPGGFDHLAAETTTLQDKLEVVRTKRK